MGLLTFATNVTLDGGVDHREGIADDETRDFFTRLMDESGAMLWGRVTKSIPSRPARGGNSVSPARAGCHPGSSQRQAGAERRREAGKNANYDAER